MKKIISFFLILILLFFINPQNIYSSSSTTYFNGEAIKIENDNIEIISDDITIDTTTSKIQNVVLLKNTSDKEISTSITIPLENKQLAISIKDLSISINGLNVKYIKNDNGEYIIKTKLPAGSGKKIEINYSTDNDLQKAKIIKYNFENFKNRTVKKVKVNVVIDEKNIPLIEKIYPGNYKFENNIISTEYYNYTVNTITKEFIVQKETFHNLLYGRETELTEEEKTIVSNWLNNVTISDNINYDYNETIKNIIEYTRLKNGKIIDNVKYADTIYNTDIRYYDELTDPLLYDMAVKLINPTIVDLKDKIVCIDFVETEDDKQLYVYKATEIEDDFVIKNEEYVLASERNILKTKGLHSAYSGKHGAKIIFVGEGINGEKLNATEEEKIQYINSINADMYIRIEIYDGEIIKRNIFDSEKLVGYYNNNNYDIAKSYVTGEYDDIKSKEIWDASYKSDYEGIYNNYEEYANNYYKDFYNRTVIKLPNNYIENNSEIPTLVQFIGNRVYEQDKYIIEYFSPGGFYDSAECGLITANKALKTGQAQKLLTANKQKNANIKSTIENEITTLEILDNEMSIQQELEAIEQETEHIKENTASEHKNFNLKQKDIIIFSSIGIAIIFCIIILIIEHKKKKRGI